jgi:type IV secretory pathway TrbF-like protein
MYNVLWVRDVTGDQKQKRVDHIKSASPLFKILEEKISNEIRNVQAERISKNGFEIPAWSEKQAYLNGMESALSSILSILPIDK